MNRTVNFDAKTLIRLNLHCISRTPRLMMMSTTSGRRAHLAAWLRSSQSQSA